MLIKFLQFFLIIIFSFSFYSCYEEMVSNPVENLPPETSLFLYPDSTISSQPSRINLYWSGDDPDGRIAGFYFTWDGINWSFTLSNDSLFALEIGVVDTIYAFQVSAADDNGNGIYDTKIFQNNINYGPEPFIDANGNNIYDNGETFFDIGLIDPSPAVLNFPIKNSAPEISWNVLSFLPDTSFSAMTFAWEVNDLDGNQTVQQINIALNDTNNSVALNGEVRRVTIRTFDFTSSNPLMDILIDGNQSNLASVKLPGLKLNDNNILYVQAVDISGAKSPFIKLPGEESTWYVKRPSGSLVIIDDFATSDNSVTFYSQMMDSLGLDTEYDFYDISSAEIPFINITFLETIKLFKYSIWFSDNNPSLDLAAASTQKYLDAGGKILYSLQFPQNVDLVNLQAFLPIIADSSNSRSTLLRGVKLSAQNTQPAYPELETTASLFRVQSFYLSDIGVIPIYYFPDEELKGYIGFSNSQKNLFFIGLPLHRLNGGNANVKALLQKVLFEDFNMNSGG